jgi:hypothetical protein
MINWKKEELIVRVNKNYGNFLNSLQGLSRSKLIEMAARIASVQAAFEHMTKVYAWECKDEIELMLMFNDPLTIVADALEQCRASNEAAFDKAMYDMLLNDDVLLADYPPAKDVCAFVRYSYIDEDEMDEDDEISLHEVVRI